MAQRHFPDIAVLKDQAQRLATYMGDKHRLRLKTSGALEALAAMYCQPDWNTLQALSRRADAAPPPNPGPDAFPVHWMPSGPVTVSAADWYRHTLMTSPSQDERRAWAFRHFAEHVERRDAGVFVNLWGSSIPKEVRLGLEQVSTVLDLNDPQPAARALNLLAGREPDAAAALLLTVLPEGTSPGADYYRQLAFSALAAILEGLRAAERPQTLNELLACLRPGDLRPLEALCAASREGETATKRLCLFIEMLKGRSRDVRLDDILGGLIGRLALVQSAPWGRTLFSAHPQAPNLADLLESGNRIVIELADSPEFRECQGRMVLKALDHYVTRVRMSAVRPDCLVVLGDPLDYFDASLIAVVRRARAARMAIAMTAPVGAMEACAEAQDVLANVWTRVQVGGDTTALLAAVGAPSSAVVCTPGRITYG